MCHDDVLKTINWEDVLNNLIAMARYRIRDAGMRSPEDIGQSAATSFANALRRGEVQFPDDFDGSWKSVQKIVVKLVVDPHQHDDTLPEDAVKKKVRKDDVDTLRKVLNRKITKAVRDNRQVTLTDDFVFTNLVQAEDDSHQVFAASKEFLFALLNKKFEDETIRKIAERKILFGESPRTIAPILGLTYHATRKASEAIERFLKDLESDPDITFDSVPGD